MVRRFDPYQRAAKLAMFGRELSLLAPLRYAFARGKARSSMIEVEHLSKSYGTVRAVSDVSFRVDRGEIVGFLGPNGAGKSTTLRILAGFLGASEGSVRIAGHDI